MNNRENILKDKSYAFAIRVVKLSQWLVSDKKEFVLSKQLLRSGTAVGALIREAEFAQSKPDFINKLSVALKEANETEFWISLLRDTDYIDVKMFDSMNTNCKELISLLVASIKTTKNNIKK
jgi:four helix bundle protein